MTARSAGSPEDSLPLWELIQVAHLAERHFQECFSQAGLKQGQFGVLASIADNPGSTQAAIARDLAVRPQSLTPIIEQLIGAGLITRAASGRGQRSGLQLSAVGRRSLDEAWPRVLDLNSAAHLGLSEQAWHHLGEVLAQLRGRLELDPSGG